MSAAGEWKTIDGRTLPIRDMEDGHLRNSLRYLYRKIGVQPPQPVPTNETPPVANTWRSRTSAQYYEDKFVELGEEAQRRNWIPQNVTYEQLLTTVGEWEREAVQRRNQYQQRYYQNTNPEQHAVMQTIPNVYINQEAVAIRAAAPPQTLAFYSDIVGDMQQIIEERYPKRKKKRAEKVERNISFEL